MNSTISRRENGSGYWPVFGLLDRLFDTPGVVFTDIPAATPESGNLAVDVSEQESDFVIKASLPGFARENVSVNIEDGVLTIKAQHTEEKEERAERFYRRERRTGSLSRRVALPGVVDEANAKAELRDGVLTLRVPKANQVRARSIEVK